MKKLLSSSKLNKFHVTITQQSTVNHGFKDLVSVLISDGPLRFTLVIKEDL